MQARDQQYFTAIMRVLKAVAFHELYMESAREELCLDPNYDPSTAFKSLDAFRHNRVTPYELRSFLQLHGIEAATAECGAVVRSLNCQREELDWTSFAEMTLPHGRSQLRDLALTRFSDLTVQVGTDSQVGLVRQHSPHALALFLEKELGFAREHLRLRQEFGSRWGGDVYTALQGLFKKEGRQTRLSFEEFRRAARQLGVLFNEQEFVNLWRRSKARDSCPEDLTTPPELAFEQLCQLLLTSNFKTKTRYCLEQNVPLKWAGLKPTPSYRGSKWREQLEWEQGRRLEAFELMEREGRREECPMKFHYSYPQMMATPAAVTADMRSQAKDWERRVEAMSGAEIDSAYLRMTAHSSSLL